MATNVFQPPPTWALPVILDEVSGKAAFNPIWLRWFLDLSQNLGSGGAGSVSSVAALTLGTAGTNLSSTVANPTTNVVITLNVPTASATNRGALSSADWTTFNSKGGGSVTSVSGTGTVSGLTLTGTVTGSGNLILGGTLSGVSLTTQVSGVLPIANGGTGTSVAGVTATITTAKLTALGADGSMTFTNGLLTSQTPAT